MNKRLFTITGPSCSGKTTLIKMLQNTGHFAPVTSFTSRQPRGLEVEGVDYYFKTVDECNAIVDNHQAAEAIKFKDNWYGIEKTEINARFNSGKTPVVIVEPKGLKQLRQTYECFTTYVDGNLELLYTRFLARFKQSPDANLQYEAKRLAAIWLEHKEWPPMVGDPDYHVVEFLEGKEANVIQTLVNASKHYNKT
jgi:guanylate kinase